jgi:hypothetical protein
VALTLTNHRNAAEEARTNQTALNIPFTFPASSLNVP